MYGGIVLVHVVGILVFIAAHAVSATAMFQVRAEQDRARLTAILGRLPTIGTGRVRVIGGLELCTVIVRHGANFRTEWIDLGSARAVGDLVNFSLFVRAELVMGL